MKNKIAGIIFLIGIGILLNSMILILNTKGCCGNVTSLGICIGVDVILISVGVRDDFYE